MVISGRLIVHAPVSSGYALNYHHFIMELLPGILRLRPSLVATTEQPAWGQQAGGGGGKKEGGSSGGGGTNDSTKDDGGDDEGGGGGGGGGEKQKQEREEVMLLAHGGVKWTRQLLEDVLHIPRHRIIYTSGETQGGIIYTSGETQGGGSNVLYHAQELVSWALENPRSPHLMEISRRALLAGIADTGAFPYYP